MSDQSPFEALIQQIAQAVTRLIAAGSESEPSQSASTKASERVSEKVEAVIRPLMDQFQLVPLAEFEAQMRLVKALEQQVKTLEKKVAELDEQ